MSAEDVIQQAAEVIAHALGIGRLPRDVERNVPVARALHDAGLLAEPDESHDPQSLLDPGEELFSWSAETWRLRGELIDALASDTRLGDVLDVATDERRCDLLAHLDIEATS